MEEQRGNDLEMEMIFLQDTLQPQGLNEKWKNDCVEYVATMFVVHVINLPSHP